MNPVPLIYAASRGSSLPSSRLPRPSPAGPHSRSGRGPGSRLAVGVGCALIATAVLGCFPNVPVVSPDGRFVAVCLTPRGELGFVELERSDASPRARDLYLFGRERDDMWRVTDLSAAGRVVTVADPAFSRDQTRLAFVARIGSGEEIVSRLIVVGGLDARLDGRFPGLSPTLSWAAVNDPRLALTRAQTTGAAMLAPAFSPSGRRIAWIETTGAPRVRRDVGGGGYAGQLRVLDLSSNTFLAGTAPLRRDEGDDRAAIARVIPSLAWIDDDTLAFAHATTNDVTAGTVPGAVRTLALPSASETGRDAGEGEGGRNRDADRPALSAPRWEGALFSYRSGLAAHPSGALVLEQFAIGHAQRVQRSQLILLPADLGAARVLVGGDEAAGGDLGFHLGPRFVRERVVAAEGGVEPRWVLRWAIERYAAGDHAAWSLTAAGIVFGEDGTPGARVDAETRPLARLLPSAGSRQLHSPAIGMLPGGRGRIGHDGALVAPGTWVLGAMPAIPLSGRDLDAAPLPVPLGGDRAPSDGRLLFLAYPVDRAPSGRDEGGGAPPDPNGNDGADGTSPPATDSPGGADATAAGPQASSGNGSDDGAPADDGDASSFAAYQRQLSERQAFLAEIEAALALPALADGAAAAPDGWERALPDWVDRINRVAPDKRALIALAQATIGVRAGGQLLEIRDSTLLFRVVVPERDEETGAIRRDREAKYIEFVQRVGAGARATQRIRTEESFAGQSIRIWNPLDGTGVASGGDRPFGPADFLDPNVRGPEAGAVREAAQELGGRLRTRRLILLQGLSEPTGAETQYPEAFDMSLYGIAPWTAPDGSVRRLIYLRRAASYDRLAFGRQRAARVNEVIYIGFEIVVDGEGAVRVRPREVRSHDAWLQVSRGEQTARGTATLLRFSDETAAITSAGGDVLIPRRIRAYSTRNAFPAVDWLAAVPMVEPDENRRQFVATLLDEMAYRFRSNAAKIETQINSGLPDSVFERRDWGGRRR